ncbi:DUF6779 domain-containing protein [uncultured Corynebacterium sp.]|uniref:DUF6779 domain-containing protein n=1 Tax=uncultured Corynebacterium sp. TaxID=159447 RepID=UPI00260F24F5|nr:DUF6779 domain-containing protein [uncultured Corynebacterium sp.]
MTAENRSRDGGNVWMIVLIALALIATVIMLFSDSAVWLQIALLAALWAAICGFLLVSRARHERERLEAEAASREREYQAEIDALRARHEADHYALEAARAGEGLPPAVDLEVLREIREELATLRNQLEDLSGREFGYEPAALQAEARRVKEIEARADRVAPSDSQKEPAQAQPQQPSAPAQPKPQPQQQANQWATQPTPAPQQPKPQQPKPQQPKAQPKPQPQPKPRADQWGADQWTSAPQHPATNSWGAAGANDDTSRIEPVRDEGENQAINALSKQPKQTEQPKQEAPKQQPKHEEPHVHRGPSSDAVAGRVGSHRAPEGRNPLTDLIRERQEELEKERQRQEAERRRQAEEARRAEAEAEEQESRGRRRADANREGALTVAELLARSKKGK